MPATAGIGPGQSQELAAQSRFFSEGDRDPATLAITYCVLGSIIPGNGGQACSQHQNPRQCDMEG